MITEQEMLSAFQDVFEKGGYQYSYEARQQALGWFAAGMHVGEFETTRAGLEELFRLRQIAEIVRHKMSSEEMALYEEITLYGSDLAELNELLSAQSKTGE